MMTDTAGDGISLTVLASGSKGNCIHISDGETAVLIDAGFSGKEIARRMNLVGLDPLDLNAILVTHEHTDHVLGAGVLSRRYHLPVYGTCGTLTAAHEKTGTLHIRREFTCGVPFAVGNLLVHPFSISHDAEDPAGFTVTACGIKIGVATDLGIATGLVRTHLKDCRALVVEANHCPDLLASGPYPWYLKQRVKSRSGHLSNQAARDLVGELSHAGLSHVVIGHLSEQNNTPEKAASVVGEALASHSATLITARQEKPVAPLVLGETV